MIETIYSTTVEVNYFKINSSAKDVDPAALLTMALIVESKIKYEDFCRFMSDMLVYGSAVYEVNR